jgi:hypothetical protein
LTETPDQSAAQQEARQKFQEALERKNRTSASRKAHEDGRNAVRSMSGPAGQKKFFRRKTC